MTKIFERTEMSMNAHGGFNTITEHTVQRLTRRSNLYWAISDVSELTFVVEGIEDHFVETYIRITL